MGSITKFHLAGDFCQISERTSFKTTPGSGVGSKSPNYVPSQSILLRKTANTQKVPKIVDNDPLILIQIGKNTEYRKNKSVYSVFFCSENKQN